MKMYAILYNFEYEAHDMLHSMYVSEEKSREKWEMLLRAPRRVGDSMQLVLCEEGQDISMNEYEELEYHVWQ
jgi:hypothetical protein